MLMVMETYCWEVRVVVLYNMESSGHITINSQIFNLFTSTLVIDSSTNNGKMALGATPNSSVGGTNKGVYMDGTGDFLVRGDADNFLKFDPVVIP